MKKLVVIGATGGIGRAVIEQAKQRGHEVTALARAPEKLGTVADGVNVIRGNPLDAEVVKRALAGHDAVLSALGPPGLAHSTVQQDGARSVVAAMQSLSMRRLLLVSAALLFKDGGLLVAILRNTLLRDVSRDCAEAESIVMGSDLEWTIARPPRLTNGSLTRNYRATDGHMPEGAGALLSRADVAHFLLDEVERAQHVRQIVGLAR
jgi:putative NADH-flavin reductase